ncbi:hypothetical protein QM012_000451 [Aureobasidium pullulans]|uniref:Uncharacterized protein n=1 Tax=Aureobasidium pullulans TaxID=5580 RepID=A0ABR0TVN3_AURPU
MLTRNSKKRSYDIAIVLFDHLETDKYGIKRYKDEIDRITTAISLSPDSKWQNVKVELWGMITRWFGSIQHAEKDDYTYNMAMSYTIDNDTDQIRKVSKSSDRAFFGLLARDDITNLELRVNVTLQNDSLAARLEEITVQRQLEKASRNSEESVEDLKVVEKLESTVSVKETKTHSCIIQ